MSKKRSEKFWICKYQFERVQPTGDAQLIEDACIINQDCKPGFEEVRNIAYHENIPNCFEFDQDFKVISIEEKKIAQFKLPLIIDPFKSEIVQYNVCSVDKEGKKQLMGSYNTEKEAYEHADNLNSEISSLRKQTHAFVIPMKITIEQLDF